MTTVFETHTPEETMALGRAFGEKAVAGEIYALHGDLGVGKTVFTKGFALGLGVTEDITSPTFTILQEYQEGRLPMYHFDVYRIDDPDEMYEVGLEDYLYGDGVTLVEWAELIADLMPKTTREVTIEKDLGKGVDYRRITLTGEL